MNNIIVIGFMGVGKTTVSKALAKMLKMDLVIIDDLIMEKEGISISNIFKEYGEEYFRNSETNTLQGLQGSERIIISTGGGIVLRDINIDYMKSLGTVVLLTASVETIYERVKDSVERPILKDNMNTEFISSLMDKRKERYEKAADIIVNTDKRSVEEVCNGIISKLNIITTPN